MRFYLVDRIEEICYGEYATGVKSISLADNIFNEHFPGIPVFPGSLILEGTAQLAGSFLELTREHSGLPMRRSVLAIVNRFKFRRPAYPGDRLLYTVNLKALREEYAVVSVKANIEQELCAEGELTFSLVDVQEERLHEARTELYRIWMRKAKVKP